jgi:hypothetical protein
MVIGVVKGLGAAAGVDVGLAGAAFAGAAFAGATGALGISYHQTQMIEG